MKLRNPLLAWSAITISVLTVIAAVMFFFAAKGEPGREKIVAISDPESEEERYLEGIEQKIEMVVFFQSSQQHDLLVPVRRKVFNFISLKQQANQLVQELIRGPEANEGLLPTVPRQTRLLRFYLSEPGTAYLVFNRVFSGDHKGGTSAELITVYSIVNTLCVNFPSIQRIQFLVEGEELATLAGHIDMSRPFYMDSEYFSPAATAVDIESPAEETEDYSQPR